MSSEKRARQKANRELKRAEEAKAAKRKYQFGQVKKYAGYAVLFIATLVLLKLIT